ncbi:MAG: hypothetical protein ACNA7J_02215 [Wenzhouxiangella sp.]
MIKQIAATSKERDQVVDRIHRRQDSFRHHQQRLREGVDNYLGSPQSLVHAFLTGFLLDQTRAVVPAGPSPLKGVLPILRWLV